MYTLDLLEYRHLYNVELRKKVFRKQFLTKENDLVDRILLKLINDIRGNILKWNSTHIWNCPSVCVRNVFCTLI